MVRSFFEAFKSLDDVVTVLEKNGDATEATDTSDKYQTSFLSLSYIEHLEMLSKPPLLLIKFKPYYCIFMYDTV